LKKFLFSDCKDFLQLFISNMINIDRILSKMGIDLDDNALDVRNNTLIIIFFLQNQTHNVLPDLFGKNFLQIKF